MLIGPNGAYEKPKFPCVVPDCDRLAYQEERGACKKHLAQKIDWLQRQVLSRPSPWAGPELPKPEQPVVKVDLNNRARKA